MWNLRARACLLGLLSASSLLTPAAIKPNEARAAVRSAHRADAAQHVPRHIHDVLLRSRPVGCVEPRNGYNSLVVAVTDEVAVVRRGGKDPSGGCPVRQGGWRECSAGCDRQRDDRGGRLGAVPHHARRGERSPTHMDRKMATAQLAGLVQSGARHLRSLKECSVAALIVDEIRDEAHTRSGGYRCFA
jgi:hypothetical protein